MFSILTATFGVIILLNSVTTALILNLIILALLIFATDVAIYRSFCARMAERYLRTSEERYALATQVANEGIWDWDLRRNHLFLSPNWKSYLGYSEDEIGHDPKEWQRLIHPEDVKQFQQDLREHLEGKSPNFANEHRVRKKNGEYAWVYCRGAAINRNHKPYRVLGSQIDITDRKQKIEELFSRI